MEIEAGVNVTNIATQSKLHEPVMAKIGEIVKEILEIKETLRLRVEQREK